MSNSSPSRLPFDADRSTARHRQPVDSRRGAVVFEVARGSPRSTRSAAADAPPPRTCSTRRAGDRRPDRRRQPSARGRGSRTSRDRATDLAHVVVTHIHLDHAGGVAHRRALPERDGLGARTRRTASRRSHSPARERELHLRGGDDGVAVRTGRTRCGPADPSSGRRRPDRARPSASRNRLDTRPREASRSARGLRHRSRLHGGRSRHPPARRAGAPSGHTTARLRSRARDRLDRTDQRAARGACPVLALRTGEEVSHLRSRVERFRAWTDAVGEALERTEDLDEIVRVLQEVARADAETGAEATLDLQPWRRCRASG
jgi:hypothetical protein